MLKTTVSKLPKDTDRNGLYTLGTNRKGESVKFPMEKLLQEAISTTWAELKALRDAGGLIAGQWYRITDYDYLGPWHSGNHPYDICVYAITSNTISEDARAAHSARDTTGYFANSKLEAWQVWYRIDNDMTHMIGLAFPRGKGVVYRLIDEWDNDCPYDFKNVMRVRPVQKDSTGYLTINPNIDVPYGYDNGNYSTYFYTFTGTKYEDLSIKHPGDGGAYKNKIGRALLTNQQSQNDIVFFASNGEAPHGNIIAPHCYNLTFLGGCYSNELREYTHNAIFGEGCRRITTQGNNYELSFGRQCNGITLGENCGYDSFGIYNCNLLYGADCRNNDFKKINYLRYFRLEGNSNLKISVEGAEGDNNYLQNIHIHEGLSDKSLTLQRGLDYETEIYASGTTHVDENGKSIMPDDGFFVAPTIERIWDSGLGESNCFRVTHPFMGKEGVEIVLMYYSRRRHRGITKSGSTTPHSHKPGKEGWACALGNQPGGAPFVFTSDAECWSKLFPFIKERYMNYLVDEEGQRIVPYSTSEDYGLWFTGDKTLCGNPDIYRPLNPTGKGVKKFGIAARRKVGEYRGNPVYEYSNIKTLRVERNGGICLSK